MDLDKKIKELRAQEAVAASRKARAQAELSFAEDRQRAALLALKTEFGVETFEEAQELLGQAGDDLAAECRKVEHALAQVRGPE